jgi:N-glycosylase/DNA lyase
VLYSHGWLYLCPAEEADGGFCYALMLPDAGACSITVTPVRGTLTCQADRTLSAEDRATLRQIVRRMLSLDFPLVEFQAVCKARKATRLMRLSGQGWGRMFRSPTCWEDAVKTLCTTNASWGYTQQMCRRLCDELGETTPSGSKAFPTPRRVTDAGEPFLKKTVGMGYRSKSLILLAENATSGKVRWLLDDSALVGEGEAENEIESWHGFGRYATRHLLVLMGFHGYLPVDREVGLHLGVRKAGDRDSKLDADHFSDWGKFRFTAYKVSRVAKRLNWIGD